MFWYMIKMALWTIAYMAVGAGAYWITDKYVDELAEKVREVDYRYEKRLYLKIPVKSDVQMNIYSVILMMCWPIVCIATILKAEWEFDTIVRHSVKRVS